LRVPARATATGVDLARHGGFSPRFWPGVNLGSTIPARFPGEVAAGPEEYRRWIAGMGDLGVRVVRIYTILRPSFYAELDAYDRAHPGAPIRFIQGVWIPEDEFLATGDAYDPAVTDGFRDEIARAVAAVHGDADLPQQPGHAGGHYGADVSRWLLAWSIGVEWDPAATISTNRANAGAKPFRGRFIQARAAASPMESWLASMLDHLATLEAARGWSRPLTFTNWLTADPLSHPDEPLAKEDAVSVDAMHIRATAAWPGGFFASYHAYPYYPDFLGLDRAYARHRRPDGSADAYAGYLQALRAHHRGQAVMITEFGVPSGLGVAHRGPLGRDQGDHDEREAGRMDADMLRAIHEEGFAGGIVFEYLDEWFKHTWNTVEAEVPTDRRQMWRNELTNEEQFGLVATEPGRRDAVTLDGRDGEWAGNGSAAVATAGGVIREVSAVHDAAALSLRIVTSAPDVLRHGPLRIAFDVRPGGNLGLPGAPGEAPGAEVSLEVGAQTASLRWASWVDPNIFVYGLNHGYMPAPERRLRPGSGVWVEPRLILNRPYRVPTTGAPHPAQWASYGTFDVASGHAGGLRDIAAVSGRVVEVRIPWALLTFSDPSSLQVWVPHRDATITARTAPGVKVTVAAGDEAVNGTYTWEPWQSVQWHERRKAGWDDVRRSFAEVSRRDG
jgi:hypothetical protein